VSVPNVIPDAVQSLGRFQVLEHNQLIAPGKCAGCGGFTNRRFIDFGLELDFYGVVYLCLETCFTEVANQIGFASPDQVESLKARIESYRGHTEILQGKLAKLEAIESAIQHYSSVIDPNLYLATGNSGVVPEGSGNEGAKAEGHPDSGSDDGKQGSSESSNESGSTDVRHDDSLDEFAKQFDI
jgi:hypothetical protein